VADQAGVLLPLPLLLPLLLPLPLLLHAPMVCPLLRRGERRAAARRPLREQLRSP
jgi:hypothetical protein